MSACEDCCRSKEVPWCGFTAGCQGCAARAAARSPQFAYSQKTDRQDRRYLALLAQFALTHAQVLEAYKTDALVRMAP